MESVKKEYSRYLDGKNIIIVGPSKSLEGTRMGKKIDSKDVIVRLNNSYPIYYSGIMRDIGSRTDVLYHTGAIDTCLRYAANLNKVGRIQILDKDHLKWYVAKRDHILGSKTDKKFLEKFPLLVNQYFIGEKKKDKIKILNVGIHFMNELDVIFKNTDANMSTLAILHLLQYNIKSLEIVGCDFYSSGYNKGYTIYNTIKWDDKTKSLIRVDGKKRRKPQKPHDYRIQIEFLLNIIENSNKIIIDQSILKKWKSKL
jgi:hypothetical protein